MDFDLSDEQRMLQQTVKQFLDNECPIAKIRSLYDDEVGFDPVLWKGLAELGVAGIHLPAEYGGSELEVLDLAVVAEILGAHGTPVPFFSHALASLAIALAGSAEQKKRWLPALASGEKIATIAFSEADEVWLPEQWKLAAGATLSGDKFRVEAAEHADVFVVGLAGGKLGVVDRSAAGIEIQRVESADQTRRLGRVHFEKTPVDLLGAAGIEAAERVCNVGLVLLAADAFGGSEKLVATSVAYAKTREQFGVIIGSFQALKHQLAEMAIEIEPTRALYWYAAHAQDHVPAEAARIASIAKSHLCERYSQVARDATEVHGGIGFTWEGDTQIWFKRAMFDRVMLGTPRLHKNRAAKLAGW
jgi:alkylation response protein AidB-like acyl-CoA dehydrogenase